MIKADFMTTVSKKHMIEITFNDQTQDIFTLEELALALDRFDQVPQFELWASSQNGASICMLRNNDDAILMFLRENGDSGFTSRGIELPGIAYYTLSNGQVDEYPKSWCIEVEKCYKAISYFFVNEGNRPGWICWNED